jgi:type I restriction enzyme M protein
LALLAQQGQTISDVASLVEKRFRPDQLQGDTFQYIEISSIRGDGIADSETVEVDAAPSRAQWVVEPGDVISSTVRPIRRLSALITEEQSGYICSSGFAVLRSHNEHIEPEVLLTYLRLPLICEILDLFTTASMYPAIATNKLMAIPIAVPKPSVRKKIVEKVQMAFEARAESVRLLEYAKSEVEQTVRGEAR